MAKKQAQYKNKSPYLQKQYDDKEFTSSFNFIMSQKGIDMTHKVVYNLMCNDFFMNGQITWKQSTYADKLGLSRQQISNIFNHFIELGVITASKSNKPGSKSNTYNLTLNYTRLIKGNNGFKKKDQQPVNPDVQTCKPQFTQPVNPNVQTCKPGFTYNTSNTCIKHVIQVDVDDSFVESSPSELKKKPETQMTEKEIEEFLKDIDI